MSSVYEDFGVTNAVISEPSEGYNEKMVSLPINVRDGDDAIGVTNANGTNGELDHSPEVEEEASPVEDPGEEQKEPQENAEGGNPEGDAAKPEEAPFEAIGDVPEELNEVSARIAESESAFGDMVADASSRGLSEESFAEITAEYEAEGGISPKSYEALAKVGYSKGFIDSFIAGQEAIGAQYMASITKYAGGEAKFQAVFAHLQANSPESAVALENAIGNRDLQAVKGIINLASASVSKDFGKPATRTLTDRATPAKVTSQKADGFETKADMIAAMKNPKYGRDAVYTRSVELKVQNAKF